MHNIDVKNIEKLLDSVASKNVAVIGDVMLDQYFWGNVSRVSPEAPVPVVDVENETYHLGGAANVAQNLVSLGVNPIMCGLLGNDNRGNRFIEICEKLNIVAAGLYRDNDRMTTIKTRIIGNNQQIVRLDREVRKPISAAGEEYIVNHIKSLASLDGIIFEDYDKGAITASLISNIISYAKSKNIPVFVDPKFSNFGNYAGATLFKPNKKETESGLGITLKNTDDVHQAGKMLLDKYGLENVLITLGKDGMVLFESGGNISSVPTIARKIADVSGAGDTAIASLVTLYIAGASLRDAAMLANFASGVVCEKPGIVAIHKDELMEAIKRNHNL